LVASENTIGRPRPEEFPDYQAYLRSMIAYLKQTRPHFSYRYFSRIAGFASPNFLKLVADGERNLTPASIPKFAKGLGLDERERDAFENLVLFTQAETDAERNRYYARLRRSSRGGNDARRLEAAQFDVYSHWYVMAIRELLLHPEFSEDPGWICRQLRPRIKPQEAGQALELLERTGLATRDDTGRLRPSSTTVSTGPRVRSLAVRNFHRAMLSLAADALDRVATDERDVTALTVSLDKAQYDDVRARIERFRRELLELIDEAAPGSASEVYQVGFQIFPLTKKET
jgi:uncharacterized protein (TIGR02147 family)